MEDDPIDGDDEGGPPPPLPPPPLEENKPSVEPAVGHGMFELFVVTEGWGCDTNVVVYTYPSGDIVLEAPLFGPDCEGWPSISWKTLIVDAESEGAWFIKSEWDSDTYETKNNIMFATEDGLSDFGPMDT